MPRKKTFIDTSVPKTLPLLLRSRVVSIPDVTLQAAKNSSGNFEYYSYKQVYEKVIEKHYVETKIIYCPIERNDRD